MGRFRPRRGGSVPGSLEAAEPGKGASSLNVDDAQLRDSVPGFIFRFQVDFWGSRTSPGTFSEHRGNVSGFLGSL
jgi:hypothetical protein